MTIQWQELLEDQDQQSLLLMEFLMERGDSFSSVDFLGEVFGLSRYKIQGILQHVNTLVVESGFSEVVEITDTNSVNLLNVNREMLKIIRLSCLKHALAYQLFFQLLTHPTGIQVQDFLEEFFISKKKYYVIRKKVEACLSTTKVQFQRNKLIGEETAIRSLSYEIFYFFYNDLEYPFSAHKQKVQATVKRLHELFMLRLTPTARTKLEIYLGIQFIRMNQRQYIKFSVVPDMWKKEFEQYKDAVIQVFIKEAGLIATDKIRQQEVEHLFHFLVVNEYINLPGITMEEDLLTKQFCAEFLKIVDTSQETSVPDYMSKMKERLIYFHLRLQNYYLEPESFIEKTSIRFFEEVYPIYNKFICQFIAKHVRHTKQLSAIGEVNLYYGYIFLLTSTVPANSMPDKVYVCVDFSQGKDYNQYIIKNLDYFSNLNIVVEHAFSTKTQLYLSDFYSIKIKCQQLIWKNPPGPLEWRNLGNELTKIKEEYR